LVFFVVWIMVAAVTLVRTPPFLHKRVPNPQKKGKQGFRRPPTTHHSDSFFQPRLDGHGIVIHISTVVAHGCLHKKDRRANEKCTRTVLREKGQGWCILQYAALAVLHRARYNMQFFLASLYPSAGLG
jgi:hypothetical protein